MGYGNWLHGEAVSAGTVMAAKTAQLQGLIDASQFERILAILKKAHLPVRTPENMTFADFMQHMMRDKKVLAGELRLVLPTSIGTSAVVKGVPEAVIAQAIEYCRTV
ncbi:3-dehydroquinate synthase [Vibrio cholerae]|nr:3-dehydroquinate synthase [Vibrio cholerae]